MGTSNGQSVTADFGMPNGSFGTITGTIQNTAPPQLLLTIMTSDPGTMVVSDNGMATLTLQSCQVTIPHAWGQAQPPWGASTYDSYNGVLCAAQPPTKGECTVGDTNTCCRMKNLGCTTTALAMALSVAGADLNPGLLNDFIEVNNDYTSTHDVQIEQTTSDVSLLTGGKAIYFDDTLRGEASLLGADVPVMDDLKSALCNGHHAVIVTVASYDAPCHPQAGLSPGGHYVLVTGEHDDTNGNPHFDIVDPGCVLGAPPLLPITSLDVYNNDFEIRGFVSDPSDVSQLEVWTDDSADLLVADPGGNLTGFDRTAAVIKKEIPRSSYGQDFVSDNDTGQASGVTHSINLFQPIQAAYQITVTGLKAGIYNLSIASFSTDGTRQPRALLAGIAAVASNSAFQVQFSPTPGSVPSVSRIATFQSTLADITNSLALGLIDNAGIANALSQKIQAASGATAEHESDDAREVLNAFKHQVNALTGKHITGVAPQVLLEDADSLLSQLPLSSD